MQADRKPGWAAAGLPPITAHAPAYPPLRPVDPADAAPGVEPWSSPYRRPAPPPEGKTPGPIIKTNSQEDEANVPAAWVVRMPSWARRFGPAMLVVALPIAGAAFMLAPAQVAHPTRTAVFTTPILVLRAAVAGRIVAVNITQGAPVQPDTVLLSIRVGPPPDPAAEAVRSRLQAARLRVTGLGAEVAAAAPPGAPDAARARQADLRRMQASATAERDQLEQAVAASPASAPDLVVRSRVRGYVRTLEAVAGSDTVAGSPVAQLADCDRAFLTLQDDVQQVRPGERVRLRMDGIPTFDGLVRPASGVSEPSGRLVIEPVGLAAVAGAACPIGGIATVTQAEPAAS